MDNQREKTICNFIRDGIVVIDKDQRVVFANNAFLDWCKKSLKDVLGTKCHKSLHASDSPCKAICPHEEVFKEGRSSLIVTHLHIDGKPTAFEISAFPIKDNDGNVIEMVEILRDISEKESLNKQIKGTADFFHTVLDSIAEGVIVVDREFKVIMANKGYLRQISEETPEGKHCYKLSHKSETPCHTDICPVRKVFITGEPSSDMHVHIGKNGSEVYTLVSAFPIKDSHGRVPHVVETINDITDKKRAEDALVAKVKELQEFYDMAVGRELRMIELKKENENLKEELEKLRGK